MRAIIFGLSVLCAPLVAWSQEPPPTAVHDVSDVLHGTTVVDPYRWLEDQDSPETRAWIDAQNQYSRSVLG